MSTIRRQSIISSIVIYIGFAIGMINVYFFTKEGLFTGTQYGLSTLFVYIATLMAAISGMAMPTYIVKFFPYYEDHLPPRKNDMMTWAMLISGLGFFLVIIAGLFFKDLIIRKYSTNAPELVVYYYWLFPLGLGLSIYNILEAYAWSIGKPVVTNFFREVLWRLITTLLIVLFIYKIIPDFDAFIKLYALTYPAIAVAIIAWLFSKGKLHFTFTTSKVTRRYRKKILSLCAFVYSSLFIFTLSQVFDSFVIASVLPDGLDKAGIFAIAQIMTSVIQAPQRSIISVSVPHLSRAWKEKNMEMIQKIYQRSSINLLLFSMGIFLLIALNYKDALITIGAKESYLLGFVPFLLLGITRVIDLGTGVNAQIIGTSSYWRFELISGVILLSLMVPLTILLTRQYGIIGPAIANLVSISVYNIIRIVFLWKKFRLFPFTDKAIYTLLVALLAFITTWFLFRDMHGFIGLILRSLCFLLLYVGMSIYFTLSPDIRPVMQSLKNRFGKN